MSIIITKWGGDRPCKFIEKISEPDIYRYKIRQLKEITWTWLLVALIGVFERNGPEKGAGLPSILGASNLFPEGITFVGLGKPLSTCHHPYLGIARLGGGLNPCPDGLGHFFREDFSKFKRAFA